MSKSQELFEIVVKGLASQGWVQSLKPGTSACYYNGPEGSHCAAGWVAAHYAPGYPLQEGVAWDTQDLDLRNKISDEASDHALLGKMQFLHDSAKRPGSMLPAFVEFAENQGLVWPAGIPRT